MGLSNFSLYKLSSFYFISFTSVEVEIVDNEMDLAKTNVPIFDELSQFFQSSLSGMNRLQSTFFIEWSPRNEYCL